MRKYLDSMLALKSKRTSAGWPDDVMHRCDQYHILAVVILNDYVPVRRGTRVEPPFRARTLEKQLSISFLRCTIAC